MTLHGLNQRVHQRAHYVVDTIAHHEGFTEVVATESGALLPNLPREVDDVTLCALAVALNDAVTRRIAYRETGGFQ